ncbi:MAG TPA: alpha/beta hydrolase [Burkholderiales bacterium]|nr:alpha/beta hydrolase [Burkholderiales bacterium]
MALQIMAAATASDYTRDPARWGSTEVAAHFPNFEHLDVRTSGAIIRLRHSGRGGQGDGKPPLLLVHGNPQNHTCWYKVAARLAKNYHVILPDLRGYGDSSLPEAGPDSINFSFRAMSQDLLDVMDQLGYEKFFLAGHDRGGRTVHRLCMDHPERVKKVCLMDIIPNHYVWTHPTMGWAIGAWHWAFMAQPEPFPERLISAVSAEFFITNRMIIRGRTGLGFLTDGALAEYVRCYTLKTITGSCRDYRATATSDFVMDTADKDKKLAMPLMVLWGARGHAPERAKEFLDVWHQYASNIVATDGMNCGHYMQEEMPERIYDHFSQFFVA